MGRLVWLESVLNQQKADLKQCINAVMTKQVEENALRRIFRVFVTRTRLQGYCRMLIFDATYSMGAEYFMLRFDAQGICNHQSYQETTSEEIQLFLQQEPYEEISYQQAIGLLKDAMMQNYKYDTHPEIIERLTSLHLMRASINQEDELWVNGANSYLNGISAELLTRSYLLAIFREDCSLTYDLLSAQRKQEEGNRDLYCLNWNHELQGCKIIKMMEISDASDDDRVKIHLLLRNHNGKALETIVYFKITAEGSGWRIDQVNLGEMWEMDEHSAINPVYEQVFVAVIEDSADMVMDILKLRPEIEQTIDGGGYPKFYKWFKSTEPNDKYEDVADRYLVQILVLETQVIFYGKGLDELNHALEFLLESLGKPLLIADKRVDTIENIYYTTVIKKEKYTDAPGKSTHYSFNNEVGQQVIEQCYKRFQYRWQYYKSGCCSFYGHVDNGWIEVYSCYQSVVAHFYNVTVEEIMEQERWKAFRWLAQMSLTYGDLTPLVIRMRNKYYAYAGIPKEVLKKSRMEFEQIKQRRIKLF